MSRVAHLSWAVALFMSVGPGAIAQQFADPEFDARVDRPAFTDHHPVVLIDAAHNNFHTADGRYKPLADLIKSDGYAVAANQEKFTADTLKDCAILIVSNAQGAQMMRTPQAASSAFAPAECDAVHDWVQAGGSLLLIADHYPWGASNDQLARKLGVEMGKSMTLDPANAEQGLPAQLNFSRLNGLLADHPILNGRDGSERIDRVVTFTGQSLKGPDGSVALLKLASSAVDQSRPAIPGRNGPARGRAQGLAITLGRGRIVVLGEAAMLSAQVNARQGGLRMGMNVPGNDNRQFALNIMHWLSNVKFPASAEAVASNPRPTPPAAAGAVAAELPPANQPDAAKPPLPIAAVDVASARRPDPGRPLSSAEIADESQASIALITGDGGSGTGFLVRPGVIATNAHVIQDEFMTSVRVRFPDAEKPQQGPLLAELLYEDTHRDLAFLRVKSTLPPLRIAASYKFRRGEDVTVIGNPGLSGELVLENATSKGVMSTRTALEGQKYYQLGIAVNPGNSGGPVFNSFGSVIGVVTRKSTMQEGLAFSIPIEDLNLALGKVVTFPSAAIEEQQSRHRLVLTVKELGGSGVVYSSVIAFRRQNAAARSEPKGKAKTLRGYYDAAISHFELKVLNGLKAETGRVRQDRHVSQPIRDKVGQLADNLEKLRVLYAAHTDDKNGNDPLPNLKTTHIRLVTELCKSLNLDLPEGLFYALGERTEQGDGDNPPKDRSK